MSLSDLKRKIENKETRLAVIGLGYVGLPVACTFAEVGFEVVGIEQNPERVSKIKAGISPIEGSEPGLGDLLEKVVESGRFRAVQDYRELSDCPVVLIAVETPVDADHHPNYSSLRVALTNLGRVMQPGSLIIVESTIAPGTMVDLVCAILEDSSGLKANVDFFLGHCPERVMPGRLLANLRKVNRVVGGMTRETAETMLSLYRHIVEAELDPSDCITAELVKTVENAYRDVQIAFANEVALISEAVGGDVWKVRELVNKSPGRHMLLPGAGVGGHCIPKDPWLLVYGASNKGVPVMLIPAARSVNDSMPLHMIGLLRQALSTKFRELARSRILVLGYTYLENSDDTRNSPSQALVRSLIELGAEVIIHDPYLAEYAGQVIEKARGCDAALLMVRHEMYQELDLAALKGAMRTPVLVDGRNAIDETLARQVGFSVFRVGVSAEKGE